MVYYGARSLKFPYQPSPALQQGEISVIREAVFTYFQAIFDLFRAIFIYTYDDTFHAIRILMVGYVILWC